MAFAHVPKATLRSAKGARKRLAELDDFFSTCFGSVLVDFVGTVRNCVASNLVGSKAVRGWCWMLGSVLQLMQDPFW